MDDFRRILLQHVQRTRRECEAGSSFFDNLDQLEGERLLVLQPLRPAGGFGEAIDEKIDRAVIEGIDMHEQRLLQAVWRRLRL